MILKEMRTEEIENFSYTRCYSTSAGILINRIISSLIVALILLTPLPFGSVEPPAILFIEVISGICLLLWLLRLFLCGKPRELRLFRLDHRQSAEIQKRTPLFHRKPGAAELFRFFSFGRWPRKNPAFNIVQEDLQRSHSGPQPYHSFFGYPVRNTGIEKTAVAFLGLLLVQMIPLPVFLTKVLSPTAYQLYATAANAAGVSLNYHPLSVNAYSTLSRFLLYGSYVIIYIVTVNTIRSRPLYLLVIFSIVSSAFFQSVYGVYELVSGNQQILGYQKKFFLNSASGTFINRNHYSAYLGIAIPLLMGVLSGRLIQLQSFSKKNFILRFLRILDVTDKQIFLPFYMIICLLVGIAFSLSLTGIVAVMIGCGLFVFLYSRTRKQYKSLLLSSVISVAVLLTGVVASEKFQIRIRELPGEIQSERSRFMAWRDTFKMFLRFPLAGTGGGTFSEVFPAFRQFGTDSKYSQTHNQYLQILSETGVLFLLFLTVAITACQKRLRWIMEGPQSRLSMLQIGACCGLSIVALHNLVDFSFEIPAVAATSMIVAGLFFGTYRQERSNDA